MPAPPSASVFINCPFDDQYQPIFEAIVFGISACGFLPRCAKELPDGGDIRIDNICQLIRDCDYSVHDISRTEVADQPYQLPRFNMPLELGLFSRRETVWRTLLSKAMRNSGSSPVSIP
jgi:hypothetical protein